MIFHFEKWRVCQVYPSTYTLQFMTHNKVRTLAHFNSETAAIAELSRDLLRSHADSLKVKSLWRKYVASLQKERALADVCQEI